MADLLLLWTSSHLSSVGWFFWSFMQANSRRSLPSRICTYGTSSQSTNPDSPESERPNKNGKTKSIWVMWNIVEICPSHESSSSWSLTRSSSNGHFSLSGGCFEVDWSPSSLSSVRRCSLLRRGRVDDRTIRNLGVCSCIRLVIVNGEKHSI